MYSVADAGDILVCTSWMIVNLINGQHSIGKCTGNLGA